jgi:hypothetical protein
MCLFENQTEESEEMNELILKIAVWTWFAFLGLIIYSILGQITLGRLKEVIGRYFKKKQKVKE